MAQARHIGKVVVRVSPDTQAGEPLRRHSHADGTYWITGGLGGARSGDRRWLARSGARHLVLSGRRPPGEAAQRRIRDLERAVSRFACLPRMSPTGKPMAAVIAEIDAHYAPAAGCGACRRHGSRRGAAQPELERRPRGAARQGPWRLAAARADARRWLWISSCCTRRPAWCWARRVKDFTQPRMRSWTRWRTFAASTDCRRSAWRGDCGAASGWRPTACSRAQGVWQARGLAADRSGRAASHALERLLARRRVYGAVVPIDWRQFLSQLPRALIADFFAGSSCRLDGARSNAAAEARDVTMLDRIRALPSGSRRRALNGSPRRSRQARPGRGCHDPDRHAHGAEGCGIGFAHGG